jgi:ubiquinone/menaquinone biosynthesis C-methylase UbiE
LTRVSDTILNADFVRRITTPLRTAMPGVYARLNAIRKRVLVRGADVDAYQANAVRRFGEVADIRGANVLELGSDLKLGVLRMLVREGVRSAHGVNYAPELWADGKDRIERDGAVLQNADAAALPFDDGSFHHVFSVATFEHVPDVARVLDEAHRVLVPGGLLYTNFGPIWSAGKGHHVHAEAGGEAAHHFIPEQNPLPDFCHLLLDPEEMRAALSGRVGDALRDAIVAWVYGSRDINRVFYHQYMDAFRASKFELLSTKPERDPVSPQLRRILEFRYPDERHFDVTNVEVVLRRTTK